MVVIKFWVFDSVYFIDGYFDGIVMLLSVCILGKCKY